MVIEPTNKRSREQGSASSGGPNISMQIMEKWEYFWRRLALKALHHINACLSFYNASSILKDDAQAREKMGVFDKPGEGYRREERERKAATRERVPGT